MKSIIDKMNDKIKLELDKRALEGAIDKWGLSFQIEMLMEECLELALAIQKFRRHKYDPDQMEKYKAIIDEIADVKIMLAQAEIIFPKKLIDERVSFKMDRLKKRLNK